MGIRTRERTFLSARERRLRIGDRGIQRAFHARRILRDCYAHIDVLAHAKDEHGIRRAWVSLIVDARRIGHVLYKEDGVHRRYLGRLLHHAYKRWAADDPLFQLVEQERNALLKEGKSTLHFGQNEDFRKVLALGEFASAATFGRRIVNWWEYELLALEHKAEALRRLDR